MNLGEKKELSESTFACEEVLTNVESVDDSVDIPRHDVLQNDTDKITTAICEEQAKADIYLPDETDDGSKKKFKCPSCEQCCTKRSNLRRHIKRFHEGSIELLNQVSADYCIACLLCEEKFSHVAYLKSHLMKLHGVEFVEQEYFFASSDEFLEWKTELEKRTDSFYIKQTGEVTRKDGVTYSYFKCNRSGNYKPKVPATQRKRRLKAYGTVKMNSHCTSVMKLIHGVNGELNVFFCATHYGHDGFTECRETMLQNSFLNSKNSKIRKIEDSKMIGSFVKHSSIETTDGITTTCLSQTSSSLSNESIVSIILETSNCKNEFICDKTFSTQQMSIGGNEMKPSSFQNHRNVVVNPDLSPDQPCLSPNSSEDTEEYNTFHSPSENCLPTAKQKLVSNLRKLINVIETCPSEEVLDFVANGVDELVNRFTPLIDNNHTED